MPCCASHLLSPFFCLLFLSPFYTLMFIQINHLFFPPSSSPWRGGSRPRQYIMLPSCPLSPFCPSLTVTHRHTAIISNSFLNLAFLFYRDLIYGNYLKFYFIKNLASFTPMAWLMLDFGSVLFVCYFWLFCFFHPSPFFILILSSFPSSSPQLSPVPVLALIIKGIVHPKIKI